MNLVKYLSSTVALFLMPLVGACDTESKWVMRSQESEKYSFTRFLEGIERFPYAAEQTKYSRVKEGFKRISIGMQKVDVKKVMGEPDYEMVHYKPKQKGEQFIYSTWTYNLKRFEKNLGNSDFDEAVVLHFKPNEELYWALPGKIAGLKSLGGPHLYPEATITIMSPRRAQ